jgi:hypothetical protein
MIAKRLRDYLLPREETLEPSFGEEVDRIAVAGLRVVTVVNASGALMLLVVGLAFPEFRGHRDAAIGLVFLLLGLTGLGLSYWSPGRSRARGIGLNLGYVMAMTGLAAMLRPSYHLSVDMVHAHMPIIVSLSLLVHIVALPLRPVQTLGFGVAMLLGYLGLTAALRTTEELTGMIALHVFLELLVVLLGSGLTALLYHQRVAAFRSRRLAEESFDALKAAQARLLLSRSAARRAGWPRRSPTSSRPPSERSRARLTPCALRWRSSCRPTEAVAGSERPRGMRSERRTSPPIACARSSRA